MTDEQFKPQLEFITRNFDKITCSQKCLKKDFITAEINKILAEREAQIANFGLIPMEITFRRIQFTSLNLSERE